MTGNGYTGQPNSFTDTEGEMAGEGERIKCHGCRKVFDGDAVTVAENFDRNQHGEFYSRCRACKVKHAEQSRAHYARHKETYTAYAKAYKEAHREELSAKARKHVACELCGRVVCWDKLTHHQATRLCAKRGRLPEPRAPWSGAGPEPRDPSFCERPVE